MDTDPWKPCQRRGKWQEEGKEKCRAKHVRTCSWTGPEQMGQMMKGKVGSCVEDHESRPRYSILLAIVLELACPGMMGETQMAMNGHWPQFLVISLLLAFLPTLLRRLIMNFCFCHSAPRLPLGCTPRHYPICPCFFQKPLLCWTKFTWSNPRFLGGGVLGY